jgi:hypothetical protein
MTIQQRYNTVRALANQYDTVKQANIQNQKNVDTQNKISNDITKQNQSNVNENIQKQSQQKINASTNFSPVNNQGNGYLSAMQNASSILKNTSGIVDINNDLSKAGQIGDDAVASAKQNVVDKQSQLDAFRNAKANVQNQNQSVLNQTSNLLDKTEKSNFVKSNVGVSDSRFSDDSINSDIDVNALQQNENIIQDANINAKTNLINKNKEDISSADAKLSEEEKTVEQIAEEAKMQEQDALSKRQELAQLAKETELRRETFIKEQKGMRSALAIIENKDKVYQLNSPYNALDRGLRGLIGNIRDEIKSGLYDINNPRVDQAINAAVDQLVEGMGVKISDPTELASFKKIIKDQSVGIQLRNYMADGYYKPGQSSNNGTINNSKINNKTQNSKTKTNTTSKGTIGGSGVSNRTQDSRTGTGATSKRSLGSSAIGSVGNQRATSG